MACNHLVAAKYLSKLKLPLSAEKDSNPIPVMYTTQDGGIIRPITDGDASKTVDAIGFSGSEVYKVYNSKVVSKVVAVGSVQSVTAEMNRLHQQEYNIIKLPRGHILLPGFIDPHVHIVPSAKTDSLDNYGAFEGQWFREDYTMKWLKEKIAAANSNIRSGEWILGAQLDPSFMPVTDPKPSTSGLTQMTSFGPSDLDTLEAHTPIFILSASVHTGYVNSPAVKLIYDSPQNSEIRETYPTEKAYLDHVEKKGGLQEIAEFTPAFNAIPESQLQIDVPKYLDSIFQTANQRGITMLYDAGMVKDDLLVLKEYLAGQPAKVRVGYAALIDGELGDHEVNDYTPLTEADINNYLFQGSVKLITDGANQGLTGYQSKPYCCEVPNPEENVGFFNYPKLGSKPDQVPPEFQTIVNTLAGKGWPLMIHGNGDKAIALVLKAYKTLLDRHTDSGLDKRHRIEHCSLLNKEGLTTLSTLGISPSFLIGHVGYWGFAFKNAILGEKAEEQLGRCKSALDKKARITLHSDYSVSPLGPLRMMEQAVTRIMEKDPFKNVLNPKEKITPEQGLRAITFDAAWQCHVDEWVGSLERGKMADYVILEEDPITRAQENPWGMRDIRVSETWVAGRLVYKRS